MVYNLEDKLTVPPVIEKVKRAGFALKKPKEENETPYWYDEESKTLQVKNKVLMNYAEMKIKGLHNVANALAVFAICDQLEIDTETTRKQLEVFPGLPHRCQWVNSIDAVTFVNDSKATNVGAAEAALSGLKNDYDNIILIAGGEGKDADFSALGTLIRESVAELILIGRDAEQIARAVGEESSIHRAINMQAAVELALRLAKSKTGESSLVLLSPACASFDMYKGFEDRGNKFVEAVRGVCA